MTSPDIRPNIWMSWAGAGLVSIITLGASIRAICLHGLSAGLWLLPIVLVNVALIHQACVYFFKVLCEIAGKMARARIEEGLKAHVLCLIADKSEHRFTDPVWATLLESPATREPRLILGNNAYLVPEVRPVIETLVRDHCGWPHFLLARRSRHLKDWEFHFPRMSRHEQLRAMSTAVSPRSKGVLP